MRKIFLLPAALLLAFGLSACGDNSTNEAPVPDVITDEDTATPEKDPSGDADRTTQEEGEGDMQKKMDDLAYNEFELEVEYRDTNGEYETELKKREDGSIKAKLDDTLNDVQKEGNDAFKDIYPIIKGLSIDQDTSKEDAIKQALEAFDLPEDYTEVELEIDFKEGGNKEYQDAK